MGQDDDTPMLMFATTSFDEHMEEPLFRSPEEEEAERKKRRAKEAKSLSKRPRAPFHHWVIPLQLFFIPVLVGSTLLMVVNLGPGVPKLPGEVMYVNPPLEIFACIGQTLIFLWTFAVCARIWRRTPDLREETIFPGLPVYGAILSRLLLRTSVIFFVLTSIYIG